MDNPNRNTATQRVAARSLRFQIGLLYTVLAAVNIVFFSLMIFENQTDLLQDKFVLRSGSLVDAIYRDLGAGAKAVSPDALRAVLKRHGTDRFVVFNSAGHVVIMSGDFPEIKGSEVPQEWRMRAVETGGRGSVFSLPYHLQLRKEDFAADFVLPLQSGASGPLYLKTSLVLREVQERLMKLYYQIGIAIIWGIVFHVAFGFFIARVFLVRLERLNQASEHMAQGDLSARADWEFRRNDEIDAVGRTFNLMAEKVQRTIERITRLNLEVQNELEIGKEVQERLLPPASIIADREPALLYRPFREVSGDLYCFFAPTPKRHLIFFADATGHGVPAALLTAVAVMGLDAIVSAHSEPADICSQLNILLTRRVSREFFMTGVLVALEKDRIRYVNAGHPPAMLIRADSGEVVLLPAASPPLGLVEELKFGVEAQDTRRGDRLVLFSDGLIETPDAEGEPFGLERLHGLVRTLAATTDSTQGLLDAIMAEFDRCVETPMDDVSVLIVKL